MKITYYIVVLTTSDTLVARQIKKKRGNMVQSKQFSVNLKMKSDENCATDDKLSCDDALSVIGMWS